MKADHQRQIVPFFFGNHVLHPFFKTTLTEEFKSKMRSQNEEFKRQLEVQKKQHQEKMSHEKQNQEKMSENLKEVKEQNDVFREEMEKQNQGLLEIKNLILGLSSASSDLKLQDPKRVPKRASSANFGGDNVDF